MFILKVSCPHCKQKQPVELFGASEYTADVLPSGLSKEQINEQTFTLPQNRKFAHFYAAGTCAYCRKAVLLEIKVDHEYIRALREHIADANHLYNGPEPEILSVWPSIVPPYSHPAIPQDIRTSFVALQKVLLMMEDSPWMAISSCRTILEKAVKDLGGTGSILIHRIKDLQDKGWLAGILVEWAETIRLLGNNATHDAEGTFAEAKELVEFTKLFLQYMYEFPAAVKELRQKTSKP